MRQLLIGITAIAAFLFSVPAAYALDLGIDIAKRGAESAGYADATETTLSETVGLAVQGILSFLAIIFTLLIIYAGFEWMTAQGDEDKVRKAQGTIRMAIIGLIIILASYSLSIFVLAAIIGNTGAPPTP